MKLTLKLCDDIIPNWCVIERAEHNGASGIARTEHGFAFVTAARFSDADVEGTRAEMLAIATAIEHRTAFHAERCAVHFEGDEVCFHSPRNSTRDGRVSIADADELAAEIRAKLGAAEGKGE